MQSRIQSVVDQLVEPEPLWLAVEVVISVQSLVEHTELAGRVYMLGHCL
jgi:hypothetical protein